MAIDSLVIWQAQWALIPKVSDTSWKQNLADYIAARVDAKLALSTYVPPGTFTFNKSVFVAGLAGVTSGTGDGVTKIASAFQSAVQTVGSLVVTPGTAFGAATPAQTFSVVASSVLIAAAGKAKIEELSSAPLVSDPLLSQFPVKLRDAFLLLTATISGTNSVAPTPGPLVDAGRSVL